MKIKEQVSEDEVIAEFLKGEINSKRFGKILQGTFFLIAVIFV